MLIGIDEVQIDCRGTGGSLTSFKHEQLEWVRMFSSSIACRLKCACARVSVCVGRWMGGWIFSKWWKDVSGMYALLGVGRVCAHRCGPCLRPSVSHCQLLLHSHNVCKQLGAPSGQRCIMVFVFESPVSTPEAKLLR